MAAIVGLIGKVVTSRHAAVGVARLMHWPQANVRNASDGLSQRHVADFLKAASRNWCRVGIGFGPIMVRHSVESRMRSKLAHAHDSAPRPRVGAGQFPESWLTNCEISLSGFFAALLTIDMLLSIER